jgi:DNA-binding transcriptional MerR regulator
MFSSKIEVEVDAGAHVGVGADLTIDELARRTGLLTSTVRLYRNKGLLPPPHRRGRVGWYGPTHVARLRLIAQLQERGFSLAGIKELLDGMDRGDTLRAVLGLGEGSPTWTPEDASSLPLADLAATLPQVEFDAAMLRRVVDLGLVALTDDGQEAVVKSPSFLRIGSELAALGVPADVILDQYELLRAETDRIANRFTEVFRAHLWEPFAQNAMPAHQVKPLIDALEKLGPLAEAVVVMCLRHSLQEAAGRFVEAEAERLGVDVPRPGVAPRLLGGGDDDQMS